jgi:hypothetical protein
MCWNLVDSSMAVVRDKAGTHPLTLVAHLPFVGKFIFPRSTGENPILPSSPINNDTSPDFSSSIRTKATPKVPILLMCETP